MSNKTPTPDSSEIEVKYLLDDDSKEAAKRLEKSNFERIIKQELKKIKNKKR